MLTAYVRARAFDVLQKATYHWRIREDLTSTGQQKARIANLARPDRGQGGGPRRSCWCPRPRRRCTPRGWSHPGGGLPLPSARARRRRGLPHPACGRPTAPSCPGASARGPRDGPGGDALGAQLAAEEALGSTCSPRTTTCARCRTPRRPASSTVSACSWISSLSSTWAEVLPAHCSSWMAPRRATSTGAVEHLEWTGTALRITGWAWLRGWYMRGPARHDRAGVARRRRHPHAEDHPRGRAASPPRGGRVGTPGQRLPRRWRISRHRRPHPRSARELVRRGAGEQDGLVASANCTAGWSGRLRCGRRRASWTGSASPPTGHRGTGLTLHVAPGSSLVHRRGQLVQDPGGVVPRRGRPGAPGARQRRAGVADVALVPRPSARRRTAGSPLPRCATVTGPDSPSPSPRPARTARSAPPTGPTCCVPTRADQPVARMSLPLARQAPPSGCSTSTHRIDAVAASPVARQVVLAPPLLPDSSEVRSTSTGSRTAPAGAAVDPDGTVFLGTGPDQERDGRSWSRPGIAPERSDALVRGSGRWVAALAAAPFVSLQEDLGPWFEERPVLNYGSARWLGTPTSPSGWLPGGGGRRPPGDREVLHVHRQWDTLLAPKPTSPWGGCASSSAWRATTWSPAAPGPTVVHGETAPPRAAGCAAAWACPRRPCCALRADGCDDHDVAGPGRTSGLHSVQLSKRARPPPRRATGWLGSTAVDRPPASTTSPTPWSSRSWSSAVYVAVLDYSALRFDWALTGKPMAFHVPDLEPWHEFRVDSVRLGRDRARPVGSCSLDDLVEQLASGPGGRGGRRRDRCVQPAVQRAERRRRDRTSPAGIRQSLSSGSKNSATTLAERPGPSASRFQPFDASPACSAPRLLEARGGPTGRPDDLGGGVEQRPRGRAREVVEEARCLLGVVAEVGHQEDHRPARDR